MLNKSHYKEKYRKSGKDERVFTNSFDSPCGIQRGWLIRVFWDKLDSLTIILCSLTQVEQKAETLQ